MKKKISVKLFFCVVWRMLSQVATSILKLFAYKNMSILGKIVWRTFQTCFAIWMLMLTLVLAKEFFCDLIYGRCIQPYVSDSYCEKTTLSSDIIFKYNTYTGRGRVYNDCTGQVITRNVSKVWLPVNGDSLAVFVQDEKRGYLNRYTGEVVIPAQYSRAWMFSGELAAVEKDKELLFINKAGDVVIDKNLGFSSNTSYPFFIKGYCPVADKKSSKVGLIDRQGDWVITPQYDKIDYRWGYWHITDGKYEGLLSANLDTVYSISYPCIKVTSDYIELHTKDKIVKQVNHNGDILVENVVGAVTTLEYDKTEVIQCFTDDGEYVCHNTRGVAKCKQYGVVWVDEMFYGLLDQHGKCITPALYTSIEAIGEDLYLCQPNGVIINGKGETVN